MRKALTILAVMIVVFVLAVPSVMAEGAKPTYKYRHLYNYAFKYMHQWFRDADGDGIPNGIDVDYTRPEDGSGYGRLELTEAPGDGNIDTQDKNRIRTRVMKRDGTIAGDSYIYRHRTVRYGE